jgi:LacI family transcriptional regulator
MNAQTEKRIRDIAAELGYRINPMARALQTGRTRMIAIMVSDITNPVYADLIRGAESISTVEGYTLVFAESHDSREQEVRSVERLVPAVDGVILVAPRVDDAAIRAIAEQKPVVVVNRAIDGLPVFISHDEPAIALAVEHLHGLGHRSLAYLSGPSASWASAHRGEVLDRAAKQRGMDIVELGPNSATADGGRDAVETVRTSGATAVIAYNDIMAMGLIAAARDRGVVVPYDLSVIGFDDVFGADIVNPALTTVRGPLSAMGRAAVERLIADVDGAGPPDEAPLASEFVLRASTGPVRA